MGKQTPLADDLQNKCYYVDSRRLELDSDYIEREQYDEIDLIVHWIKVNGIKNLTPLKCYKKGEKYMVRRGSRRLAAIRILEAESGQVIMVPIILIKKGDNEERQYFEQATENDSKAYTPWEKAKVLRRSRNVYGWSEKKQVEESGWSITTVRNLLSLIDGPERLTQLVRRKKVSATLAINAIAEDKLLEQRGEPPVKVAELIEEAEKNGLPTITTELELFPPENETPKSTRTTKRDLHKPVSFKKVDKWIANVNEEKLSAKKRESLALLRMWTRGELTQEYFNEFFGIEAE